MRPGDTVVDCTFGGGGHAALLADDLHGRGHFVAIDRDPDATPQLEAFAHALPTGVELSVLRNSFARALEELAEDGFRADAILFDLGVSSMQLDQPSGASPTRPTRRSTCAWIRTSSRVPPTW